MGEAVHAGVAYLQPEFEDDLVQFAEVTPEARALRYPPGGLRVVPRLCRRERPHRRPDGTPLAPWEMRLALLFVEVRRQHGDKDLRVEWSDDRDRCTLVAVAPLSAPVPREELFVPASPSHLDLAKMLTAARAIPLDPVVVVDGIGQVNLSLLTDAVRRVGLPTRVVTRVYGGRAQIAMRARPGRVLRQLPTLWRQRRELVALLRAGKITVDEPGGAVPPTPPR